jgi:hypothetical protein
VIELVAVTGISFDLFTIPRPAAIIRARLCEILSAHVRILRRSFGAGGIVVGPTNSVP